MTNRKTNTRAMSKPFAAAALATAKEVAGEYQILVSQEDGHWYGHGLEMPHVFGDGSTSAACIADTQQALKTAVAYLLEQRQSPPAPARSGKRTQQVNVRLTADEKALLESTARRKGYSGMSDFIRAAALDAAN